MKTPHPVIAPSILAADYTQLGRQIQSCIDAGTEWLHCDIMDGHFVPNISYGPGIVEAAASVGNVFIDVHLMIENPDQYVEDFIEAGADLLTVHQEVCPHLHRTIQHIKKQGAKAGVAVNPATPLQHIIPILSEVDLVLIMSVNPGFGGQSFIESSYQKLQEARNLREKRGAQFHISVDGGVGPDNTKKIARAGADVFVAGSSIFKSDDIAESIKTLTDNAAAGNDLLV
jgi:ribulose-phosphate 3-epimerase